MTTNPSPKDTFDVNDPFAENFSFEAVDNPEEIVRTVEALSEVVPIATRENRTPAITAQIAKIQAVTRKPLDLP